MNANILNILDRVNDAILAFDKEGIINYVNKAFSDVLGLETSQMVGKNIGTFGLNLLNQLFIRRLTRLSRKGKLELLNGKVPILIGIGNPRFFLLTTG